MQPIPKHIHNNMWSPDALKDAKLEIRKLLQKFKSPDNINPDELFLQEWADTKLSTKHQIVHWAARELVMFASIDYFYQYPMGFGDRKSQAQCMYNRIRGHFSTGRETFDGMAIHFGLEPYQY